MRIGQETHVEHQIGFAGQAVAIRKRGYEHRKRGFREQAKVTIQYALEFAAGEVGRINGDVGTAAKGRQHFAFARNAVGDRAILRQRMAVPGFRVAPAQFVILAIQERDADVEGVHAGQVVNLFDEPLDTKIPGSHVDTDGDRTFDRSG